MDDFTADEFAPSFGSPSLEFVKLKDYEHIREIGEHETSNADLLLAMLTSADAIFDQLNIIRKLLQKRSV